MTDRTDSSIIDVPGNPRPDGARIVWFEGVGGRKLNLKKRSGQILVPPQLENL